jgi:surface carbohydrate biosynthesis protein (TIGR04326 family)
LLIFDILGSLCSWFRITDLANLAQFRGCDYRPLFYRELLLERGSTSFPRYRLWHRAMLRIAADLGPKVKCLIYPFENQPWEKLLCLAWRRRAPHVQLIGYQHSRVPPLLLSYALSGNEVEMTPLPDRIVANGEATLQSLRAAGFPDSKLANGGALRYEYLYSGNGNGAGHAPAPGNGRTSERKSVLVAFPLSPPHCKGLLADLLDEFKTPLFAHDGDRVPIQLVLKCHPWLPLKRFHRGKAILPEWAGSTEEPIEQELARADLLLYVPSTTIWREAYLAGVPVLKYEVDLLDLDPPDSLNAFSVHPCRKESLRGLIRQLLAKPPAKKPPPEVLAKTFGRVNEQFWATIVQAGAE